MTGDVIELRRYTLHPGRRDVLIDLFEREFVETQEAHGMAVIGQFRDLDDPDRFVWLRGFRDMAARREALAGFYGGPVWRRHRDAANATMVDSDDVALLRPAAAGSGFVVPAGHRPPVGTDHAPSSIVVATIYRLRPGAAADFTGFFERLAPVLVETGAVPLAYLETEHAENTFPALPVRTGEDLFVWFASFADGHAHRRHLDRLDATAGWRDTLLPELSARLDADPQCWRLAPTARSLLR